MNKVLSNKKTIAIFILPAFLLYGVFVLIPIIYNIYLSMFQTDLMGKKNFVLFRNYMNLLNDKIFLKALKNNGMVHSLPICPWRCCSEILSLLRSGEAGFFSLYSFFPLLSAEPVWDFCLI